MGLNVSKLFAGLFGKKELRILMVGLDAAGPALSPFESLTSDQRFCTSEKQRRGTWYRARRWTQRVHKSLVDGGVSSSLQDGKLLGSAYGSQAPDLCY